MMNPTFEQLFRVMSEFRSRGFRSVSTIQVYEALYGHYIPNRGVNVNSSPNAYFGRVLAKLAKALGIRKLPGVVKGQVADGGRTSFRRWELGE